MRKGEILEFTIRDVDTDDTITLRYRRPYTREVMRYDTGLWDLEKKILKSDEELDETRVEWGYNIVEGVEIKSTRMSPISSDPESAHYRADWKEWLKEKAPQVLETLALKAFQGINLNKPVGEGSPEKKS